MELSEATASVKCKCDCMIILLQYILWSSYKSNVNSLICFDDTNVMQPTPL